MNGTFFQQAVMMRIVSMRMLPLLCAALLAAVPTAMRAQSVTELAPGTRVRVVDPGTGRIVGTVAELRGDSLVVLSGKGDRQRRVTLSVSSMRTLQVSRGRTSRPVSALQGAGFGLVGGAAAGMAGAALATLTDGPCDRATDDDLLCFSTAEWAVLGFIIGAPLGVAYGAAAGFVFPRERWQSVALWNPPAVTLTPRGDRVQLALSFSW